jgi:hypothetical protein
MKDRVYVSAPTTPENPVHCIQVSYASITTATLMGVEQSVCESVCHWLEVNSKYLQHLMK